MGKPAGSSKQDSTDRNQCSPPPRDKHSSTPRDEGREQRQEPRPCVFFPFALQASACGGERSWGTEPWHRGHFPSGRRTCPLPTPPSLGLSHRVPVPDNGAHVKSARGHSCLAGPLPSEQETQKGLGASECGETGSGTLAGREGAGVYGEILSNILHI